MGQEFLTKDGFAITIEHEVTDRKLIIRTPDGDESTVLMSWGEFVEFRDELYGKSHPSTQEGTWDGLTSEEMAFALIERFAKEIGSFNSELVMVTARRCAQLAVDVKLDDMEKYILGTKNIRGTWAYWTEVQGYLNAES